MKALLWIVLALAGLIAMAWIVELLIPREHVASRSARFAQAPEAIWQLLADYPGYPKWAPEVSGVKRLADRNGHPEWALEGKWPMPLEVEVAEPPRRMVTRIADPNMPFGGTWTWEIEPDGSGSRVTVTERGEIKVPLFRFMTRFLFGYASTLDTYLKAMGRPFSESVTPGPGGRGA